MLDELHIETSQEALLVSPVLTENKLLIESCMQVLDPFSTRTVLTTNDVIVCNGGKGSIHNY